MAIIAREMIDGGILQEWAYTPHSGEIETRRTDTESERVKRANLENQKISRDVNPAGEMMLRFSHEDFAAIKRLYPDLGHPDKKIRTEAWHRFARSPISRPFHRTRFPGQNRIFTG